MPGITANDDEGMPETDANGSNDGGSNPDGDDSESPPGADGIQLDMISAERIDGMRTMEKIRLILDGVHDGNIVILEKGLEPEEESKLIEVTMSEINPDGFTGIEIETHPGDGNGDNGLLGRIMGREKSNKLTVIGPANQIETLHKDETLISTLVTRT
jgi:hypothetical protein